MPRLGRFSVPVLPLSQCLLLVKQAFPVLKSGVTRDNLAQAWNLSPRSGWFNSQVAALKNYGLIEGRGRLRITALAEKLLFPVDENERLEAQREAWLNVEIIRLLHEKLQGALPDDEGPLIALLQEITGASRDKIKEHLSLVKKLYSEAVEVLGISGVEKERLPTEKPPSRVPSGIVELRMGDVRIWLPPTKKAIKMAKLLLSAFERSLEGAVEVEDERVEERKPRKFFRETSEGTNDTKHV